MKSLIFLLSVCALTAQADPANPTANWRRYDVELTWSAASSTPPECPKKFCQLPDGGMSWKFWCSNQSAQMFSNNTILAGLTKFNGTTCRCTCVGELEE